MSCAIFLSRTAAPNGEDGRGVRGPDVWPVDIRREMAVDNLLTNVGFVR